MFSTWNWTWGMAVGTGLDFGEESWNLQKDEIAQGVSTRKQHRIAQGQHRNSTVEKWKPKRAKEA